MAIPADTYWEVETTGADTNGGGFSVANKGATGVDMTYGAGAAIVTYTTLSGAGGTALTCAGPNAFTNTMLGNVINIAGQGLYCITAFTSTTQVTVDRTLGTFSATSGSVGGALVSPGKAGSVATAGNQIHIKAGTYTVTSATANVANGCLTMPAQSGVLGGRIVGYEVTRGDGGVKPLIKASGIATFVLVTVGVGNHAENLFVDGSLLTSARGMAASSGRAINCKATGCTNYGILGGEQIGCEAYANSGANTSGLAPAQGYHCVSHDNVTSCAGFYNAATLFGCLAYGNAGAGFSDGGSAAHWFHCTAHGNGANGFNMTNGSGNAASVIAYCVAYGNTGVGVHGSTSTSPLVYDLWAGANTVSAVDGSITVVGLVALTANPFTSSGTGDFSPNATAGGGALIRAASQNLDGGGVQHLETGGGGGNVIVIED